MKRWLWRQFGNYWTLFKTQFHHSFTNIGRILLSALFLVIFISARRWEQFRRRWYVKRYSKYWAIFKTQLLSNFAYIGNFLSSSISIIIFMFVFAQLWKAVYGAMGTAEISGLSQRDTLWYLLIAEVIVLSQPQLARQIAQHVRDGSVAYLLNKPYHFLLYQCSVGFGNSILRIIINALVGGTFVWWMVGPPPSLLGWPLVILAVLIAWLIDFCINAIIGMAAFVTEEVRAFEWIYQKVLFILGGLLIPLDFYPPWLQTIAKATPFAYTVYGPARLFVEPSLMRLGEVMVGQLFWLFMLATTLILLYRRGTTWLAINGG